MADDDGTIHALRTAIARVRNAPRDPDARRRLRAIAAEHGSWEALAVLLADEARAAVEKPELAAAFYEELADVHENLDQPLEVIAAMEAVVAFDPYTAEHHDRLAWLYRRAGAEVKAAEAFERVAELAKTERARAALRAAGTLYRANARLDHAARVYRHIVERRPSDIEAWRALEEVLSELKRWRDVAEVRGELAARANGVEKAVLMRSQARALEQAGEHAAAAKLVAAAAGHAPDDVSGLVDYASLLARDGRTAEAAAVLGQRIADAVAAGAPEKNIAAMRLTLVDILESCGERGAARGVLDTLLDALPSYVPALERLVQYAARDPDPHVHAEALLRLAAAHDQSADPSSDRRREPARDARRGGAREALALVREAARRYRAAGDVRRAAETLERATTLDPDDADLRAELEDARTVQLVEIAAADASAGDVAAAESSLRTILASRPMHLEANLALAEVLTNRGRARIAAEHLRTTLAAAPPDTPPELLAKLVHRMASVMRTLGDADQAHQLLHEAHHLDRRDLRITLALGESCFTRKLWREAAIHLGSLADHPDARTHRGPVAAGLYRAGVAEIRALRPQNAPRHYEAAVRVDPDCAPAWHALAELATEAGDIVRAADCLEREASATKAPDARLRLFDALGDLSIALLGDTERAERCWSRVAGAMHAPVLEKLLALQRKRGSNIERGETCERLAAVVADPRRKKELTEEAAQAFAGGGDLARALAVADYLMTAHPHDVDTVTCASKIAVACAEHERAAGWLRRALLAWEAAGNHGDGDPRRADLWRTLGDAERGRGNERAALDAYQRAVVASPESDGALAARRGLIELASSFGRSANTSRLVLVEAEQDPADIIASAREFAAQDAYEDARAMYELARVVGVELLAEDEQFLASHPPRPIASDEAYAAALDETERRILVEEPGEGPIGDLMLLLGEAAGFVCPDARTALDLEALCDAKRLPPSSESAVVAMYPQVAKALGGPPTLLYADPSRGGPDLRLVLSAPPVLLVGPRLAAVRARSRSDFEEDVDAELRFRLGRIVELARPHRLFVAGSDRDSFARLVAGLWHAFGKPDVAAPHDVAREAERLRHALPVALRRRMTERLAALPATALDLQGYVASCQRAADRAGLIACGHSGIAVHLAGGRDAAPHLVQLAASNKYRAARRKLRRA